MSGYAGRIYHMTGATIVLNLEGWGMYVLVGDTFHTFIGWPFEECASDDISLEDTGTFTDFLAVTPAAEIVNHLTDLHATLFQSEQEVRDELIRIIAEFLNELHENRPVQPKKLPA